MTKKVPLYSKDFKKSVNGYDPITKGHFVVDWAFVRDSQYDFIEDSWEPTVLSAVGQITISGKDNSFYDAVVKTPLLIQDHPLSVEFKDGIRFIKITNIGQWSTTSSPEIVLSNVEFEFLDNLNYFESITDFKDQNLL